MIAQCKWSSNDGNSWRFSLQHSISPYAVISPILGSARIEKIFKLAYVPADIRKWWICWGRRYHQGIAVWFKYFGFFVAFYTIEFHFRLFNFTLLLHNILLKHEFKREKQLPWGFIQKICFKNFCEIHRKTSESLLWQGFKLKACNSIKKRVGYKCFYELTKIVNLFSEHPQATASGKGF